MILLPWLSAVLLYVLLAAMLHFRLAHPHFLPVTLLLALLAGSSLTALFVGLSRTARGPDRRRGLRLLAAGTFPLALVSLHWAWIVSSPMDELRGAGYHARILLPVAESLLDLAARFSHPVRTEGRKVVMLHAGLPDAAEQVEAMDRHVERLEALLGQQAGGKVHWVRGGLLGFSRTCLFGVAQGSEPGDSPPGPDGLNTLDRHEVAHWVINRFYQSTPPAFLIEGWAEAQSGYSEPELLSHAYSYREDGRWVPLSQLLLPGHEEFSSRIYHQGGALVHYLLARHGGPAFFKFYHDSSPAYFSADCRRHLGVDLDQLDQDYGKFLDDSVREHGGLTRWRLGELRRGPGVDLARWHSFLDNYGRSVESARPLLAGASLRFTIQGAAQHDVELSLNEESAFRHQRGKNYEYLHLVTPNECWRLRRQGPEGAWTAEGEPRSCETAKRDLRHLREEAATWAGRDWLGAELGNLVDGDLATVTELHQFEEKSRPLLRVSIEIPHAKGRLHRWTWVLDPALAFVPLVREEYGGFPSGQAESGTRTVRTESTYRICEGQPILLRQESRTTAEDGTLLGHSSVDVKDFSPGPVPPERFTLKGQGIEEQQVQRSPLKPWPPGASSALPRLLCAGLLGWLAFCLLAWPLSFLRFTKPTHGEPPCP